jgi:N6-adenosine-specific RNA methylase IME4
LSKEIVLAPVLGTLTRTSWTAPEGMTFEQWTACGEQLLRMESGVQWWIGDWWRAGQPYGDRVEAVKERLALSIDTVRNYASVAKHVSLRNDTLSFTHHALVAKFEPKDQKRWLERAAAEDWTVRDFRLALARDRLYGRHEALSSAKVLLPDQRFPLVYADPPWRFELGSDLGRSKTADMHYECMTVDDICNLMIDGRHISQIAADDCALFLWCTSAGFVCQALPVLEVWGFKYVTQAIWDKQRTGTGYVFRNQHEHLIYAKRGNIPEPIFKPSSVFSYPRGAHSAKPPEVRQALEKMYPAFGKDDRIELFARGSIPGWTVWGNEAVQETTANRTLASNMANTAPVAPKLEQSVKELFLTDALKRQKAHRMTRALRWRASQPLGKP